MTPDYALGTTFDVQFTTRAFATGVPTTLAGTPSMEIYVDNNTTPITAGITLSVDFSGVAGLNNVRVVATSGNGYATASAYSIVIAAGTVGGTSVVGEVVGDFTIEKQSALRPTTAGRTLDVSAGGESGLDWANIGSPTTAQNLSGTNIDTDQVVASVSGAVGSVTGAVGSVTGNVGGNVTGSVGSVGVGGIGATSFAASAIDAAALATDAVNEIRDAIFARVFGVAFSSLTFGQMIQVLVAAEAGKTSGGATTTFTIRNTADSADVIVATVDADGNRTAVTLTP